MKTSTDVTDADAQWIGPFRGHNAVEAYIASLPPREEIRNPEIELAVLSIIDDEWWSNAEIVARLTEYDEKLVHRAIYELKCEGEVTTLRNWGANREVEWICKQRDKYFATGLVGKEENDREIEAARRAEGRRLLQQRQSRASSRGSSPT